ncbi:hypothetical protein ACO22_02888 [Paracoccidioides brasiliensis]|uniref:Sulfatase N-terminal domain-containing protein n=1 Tax=Paracoccidioides brasiliensis TaxID=121759 RepID=A0A1D2JHI9_PARBR|nr:hypothetical protein ACO22_02888 [Paracoccidioides brasiliensis]
MLTLSIAFYAVHHPINGSWLAVDSRSAEERSITMAMFNMAANATGIAGSQIFRQKDRSLYVIGCTKMSERPNFLILVADDLGFSDGGALGEESIPPNLDYLARDGLRLTDFHAASASSPTRCMLLSGTDDHTAGVGAMIKTIQELHRGKLGYKGYLRGRVAAVPEILRDAGYYTVTSGKWHLCLTPDHMTTKAINHYELRAQTDNKTEGAANHMGWEPQLQNSDELPGIFESTPVLNVEDEKEINLSELDPNFYSTDAFADKLMSIRTIAQICKRSNPSSNISHSRHHTWLSKLPIRTSRIAEVVTTTAQRLKERIKRLNELDLTPQHVVAHDVVAPGDRTLSGEWETLTNDEKRYSLRTMGERHMRAWCNGWICR